MVARRTTRNTPALTAPGAACRFTNYCVKGKQLLNNVIMALNIVRTPTVEVALTRELTSQVALQSGESCDDMRSKRNGKTRGPYSRYRRPVAAARTWPSKCRSRPMNTHVYVCKYVWWPKLNIWQRSGLNSSEPNKRLCATSKEIVLWWSIPQSNKWP
jgi:hypothetical protein